MGMVVVVWCFLYEMWGLLLVWFRLMGLGVFGFLGLGVDVLCWMVKVDLERGVGMGWYEYGGLNVIGIVVMDEWVVGWIVDILYIYVWLCEFFDVYEEKIWEYLVWGDMFFWLDSDNIGYIVVEIGMCLDLDEMGWLKFFEIVGEYVVNELWMWVWDDGVDYSEVLVI